MRFPPLTRQRIYQILKELATEKVGNCWCGHKEDINTSYVRRRRLMVAMQVYSHGGYRRRHSIPEPILLEMVWE